MIYLMLLLHLAAVPAVAIPLSAVVALGYEEMGVGTMTSPSTLIHTTIYLMVCRLYVDSPFVSCPCLRRQATGF